MIESLSEAFDKLEKIKAQYELEAREASQAQRAFRITPESWTMMQVMNHLYTTEKYSIDFISDFSFARKNEKLGIKQKVKSWVLRGILSSPIKFKRPSLVTKMDDAHITDLDVFFSDWKLSREKLKHVLDEFPKEKLNYFIFKHPLAGKLNIKQTLLFFQDHLRHHQYQIARIKGTKGFPE